MKRLALRIGNRFMDELDFGCAFLLMLAIIGMEKVAALWRYILAHPDEFLAAVVFADCMWILYLIAP